MIRVNGIPLNNPALGWELREGSVPYGNAEVSLNNVAVSGRDGTFPLATTTKPAMMPLRVNTAPKGIEALNALFTAPTLTLTRDDRPDVEAVARLASAVPEKVYHRNEWVDMLYVLEIPGVYWRGRTTKTYSVPLSTDTTVLTGPVGFSAPITDGLVRVKGAAQGIRVTDLGSGSWLILPNLLAGQYAIFDMRTGLCGSATTDTWTINGAFSGATRFDGSRGWFEVRPRVIGSDPSKFSAQLSITATGRSGAVAEFRARSAHAL